MPYADYLQRGSAPVYDSDPGTHPLIPEDMQKEIIKNAVELSAAGRFMKKRRLARGTQRQPVLDTKPTAYFLNGETDIKQTTTVLWKNVNLIVEEIACIVVIPEALLADVDYDLWDEIRPEIEEAFGVALDAAIFFGIGKPASWPTDIATAAIAAGNTVTQGQGVDVASDISNVMASVDADGFSPNGIVMRQDMRASLRNLRDTTNGFIFKPGDPGAENSAFGRGMGARDGHIFDVPSRTLLNGTFEAHNTASANAAKLFAGDWSQSILGVRQDLTAKRFDQGIVQDGVGDIQHNLMQQDKVATRFVARFAWAVPNPVTRLQPTEASRYPFGILRDAA